MKIGDDGIEIFERLGLGDKLTSKQEQSIIGLIKIGGFNDTQKIVQMLKSNSEFFRNKSGEQMGNFVDAIKQFRLYEANRYLESAIVSEWEGAAINAQANRIDNAAKQAMNPTIPPIAEPSLKDLMPAMPQIQDLPLTFNGKPVIVIA